MVKYEATTGEQQLDKLFHALADPTRRAILDRLSQGTCTVSELASPFKMSLPAISKHLRVLEDATLLSRTKDGRIRHCQLRAQNLKAANDWLEHYRLFWEDKFDALENYLSRKD